MRILQILPELNVGGVETGTVDFANYLKEHGHHSVVVSHGGHLVDELVSHGSKHYVLPVHKKSFWTAMASVKRLKEIIIKEKIDIVHARSRVPAWIAYFATRKTSAEFITTCHGYYSTHLLSKVMGMAKLVIVISDVIGRHMIDGFGVPTENIRLIPRSVDLERFRFRKLRPKGQSSFVVTMVGRITPLKGHTYFLQAMAKVIRQMPYVRIQIVGDAPAKKPEYRQELEVLARRLGLSQHVHFLGSRRDIPEILAQSDALVLSTVTQEAFGRVVLEAQACGVPVVATQVGGVVSIVDHEQTGLLVQPKDVPAMAQAVIRVLSDRTLVKHMTELARKRVEEKYTLRNMAESTLKVYRELRRTMNILVIKISAAGDVVLVTASLKALRRKYPYARIYVLVGKGPSTLLQRCTDIDGIIVYDHAGKDGGGLRFWKLGSKLRAMKFDKVIDFQNNKKSHALAWLAMPRASYGYRNSKWGWLLTDGIKDSSGRMPPVQHQFQILAQLGIEYQDEETELQLLPSEADYGHAQTLLDSEWLGHHPHIVGINLAASERWPTKNWPAESIAKMCDLLAEDNVRVIMTGMDKDKPIASEVLKRTKAKPADFTGKTNILQLAALISFCQAYVTPDSAPMHIAAAMDVPLIALFGPTDYARHMPPAKLKTVIRRDLRCAPCYGGRCKIMTHACMREITPQEVVEQVKAFMKHKAHS